MRWQGKEDAIDVGCLMAMALLHCPHDEEDTGKIFYQVLQGGGVSHHPQIAASDKDIAPCFTRMCQYATTALLKLHAAHSGAPMKYND